MGCHCFELSEVHGDIVDTIADCQWPLDRFYRPGLDLQRLCRDCKKCDTYCHTPIAYPDSRIPSQAPSEPTTPEPTPSQPIPAPPVAPAPLPTLDTSSLQELAPFAVQTALSVGKTSTVSQPTTRIPQHTAASNPIPASRTASPISASPSSNLIERAVQEHYRLDDLAAEAGNAEAATLPLDPGEVIAVPIAPPTLIDSPTPISTPAGVTPSPTFYQHLQRIPMEQLPGHRSATSTGP